MSNFSHIQINAGSGSHATRSGQPMDDWTAYYLAQGITSEDGPIPFYDGDWTISEESEDVHDSRIEVAVSQQSIKIHHHAPIQARAILALLAMVVAAYLGYLLWPYRGLIVVGVIVLAILAALIGLLRLAWPLIVQIHTLRGEQQRLAAPAPHDYPHEYRSGYRSQDEQEMYLSQ